MRGLDPRIHHLPEEDGLPGPPRRFAAWPGQMTAVIYLLQHCIQLLRRIGKLGRVDSDLALDQPADGRDVALRIDADGIGDGARRRTRTRSLPCPRPCGARGRSAAPPASPCPGCRDRTAPTSMTAPDCRLRRRRRCCDRPPRRAPARGASSRAAPARWGLRSACSRRWRRSQSPTCGRDRRPGCRPAPQAPRILPARRRAPAPAPTTMRSAASVSFALVTTASLPSGSACRPAQTVSVRMSTPKSRWRWWMIAEVSSSQTRARMRGAISITVTLMPSSAADAATSSPTTPPPMKKKRLREAEMRPERQRLVGRCADSRCRAFPPGTSAGCGCREPVASTSAS